MPASAAATVALRRWSILLCLLAAMAAAMVQATAAQAAGTRSASTAKKKAAKKKARCLKAAKRKATAAARTKARKACEAKSKKKPAASPAPAAEPQGPGSTGAASAAAGTAYGVNAGQLWQLPEPQLLAALSTLRAGGVTTVRQDVHWHQVEPTPGARDWSETDARVLALARAGLRLYPLIAYSAPWAAVSKGDMMSRPADPAAYAAFAGDVAGRYGPGGRFWQEHPEVAPQPTLTYEIWNEPNFNRFWREQDDAPERYADLFVAAHGAISARQPGARLVTAGLVERGATGFIRRMYRARPELTGKVAGVGYHAYNPTAESQVDGVRRIRKVLDDLDPDATIEITETGYSTTSISEAGRATEFPALVRGLLADELKVGSLIPYVAVSSEGDPDDWEQWFGILNKDGTPKPSGAAFLSAVRAATL